MMFKRRIAILIAAAIVCGVGLPVRAAEPAKITVESSKFKQGEAIPAEYAGAPEGKNVNPPITWKGAPEATKQFAMILDDPKAPTPQPFVHWVIYKIPATAKGLPEAVAAAAEVKEPKELTGAIQGLSGRRQPGYMGPAPPKGSGPHEYHFKVYALDQALELAPGLDKTALLKWMEGHIIGQGEIMGTYERK